MFEPFFHIFEYEKPLQSEIAAIRYIEDQVIAWRGCFQRFEQSFSGLGESESRDIGEYFKYLSNQTISGQLEFIKPHDPERGFIVSGQLPLLAADHSVYLTFIERNPYAALGMLYGFAGGRIRGLDVSSGGKLVPNPLFSQYVIGYALQYFREAYEAKVTSEVQLQFLQYLEQQSERLELTRAHALAQLAVLKQRNEETASEFNAEFARAKHEHAYLRNAAQNSMSSINEKWAEFLAESTAKINAVKNLAREAASLDSAQQVWSLKKRKHSRTFGAGLIAFAALVALAVGAFYNYFSEVNQWLLKDSGANLNPLQIVLFVVPLIAIAWVLRIFVRYITNALTLGEDAEQRKAMLETYLLLVGNPDAKMEGTDRILVLNALFRPLPGHQSDDVAPPTLLDLAKEAFQHKKG